jgi:hypothetical protein
MTKIGGWDAGLKASSTKPLVAKTTAAPERRAAVEDKEQYEESWKER